MPGRTYMAGSFSRLNRHLVGPLKHCTLPPYATRPTRHSNAPHWGFHTRAKPPKGCHQRMPQWWPLMVISEQAPAPATPSTPMCGSVVAGVCSPPQNCERNYVAMGDGAGSKGSVITRNHPAAAIALPNGAACALRYLPAEVFRRRSRKGCPKKQPRVRACPWFGQWVLGAPVSGPDERSSAVRLAPLAGGQSCAPAGQQLCCVSGQ